MKKQINELVEQYLNYFNKTTLIIAIDDMDLQTRHAFEMVEQIRKYLIIPNIIIFAGIKLVQLKDILKQNYYKEYELLIEKGLLSDSIENLVERYIAKLLPNNQQLHLPDLLDNLDRKIKIKNEGEKEEELIFDSIDEAVLHLIFRKTRYMFYNSNGNKNPIIPSNLRDLWGVLSLLYSMDNIPKDNNESIVYENRLKFQEYFIESWCYEHLDSNYYKFIQEIIEYDVSEVNKKVVDYLSVVCSKYGIKWDLRLTYYYNRPYNISLADVDYFLDRVGRIKHQPIIDNFVFALRTVYSMLLYKALENSKNQQSKREELKKKDRLYRFTDYEKLLGGELIQPENVFEKIIEEKPTPENTTSKSVSTKKTQKGSIKNIEKQNANEDDVNWHESKSLIMKKIMHHHTINKQELNKLWTSLITEKNTYDMESELEYDMRLNICSFFLLTTYSTTAHAHYRSSRFCYYTYYIADVFSDKYECVYSSFSALFNTCRYYHEYKDGNKRRQNVSMWNVLMKDNQTLFSKILYYNKIDSIGESEYRNKELEQVFIRNLEILDNLQDSLPYINNKLVVNNAEECINELINMYKKMSEYKFLIYPREKGGKSKIITFEVYTEICLFLEKIKQDRIAKETFFKIFKGN
ncbi:MAG: hypothetical protein LBU84_12220 [Prevotella sp.]|nr:hypothetical protein [Prevotella sp.]